MIKKIRNQHQNTYNSCIDRLSNSFNPFLIKSIKFRFQTSQVLINKDLHEKHRIYKILWISRIFGSSGKCEQLFTKKCDHEYQVQNISSFKSDDTPIDNQESDAELSFSENLITIDKELSVLNLNAGEKAIHYREKAMTEIATSQETLNVVKTALSKHVNPVPCDLCGKLMKNIKGVKLHMAKKT
ncbi:hypothetical protein BpHYR1_019075 [Brachionus plicatilis]|uniref:C2H2-type domain-containing protein n=1 Tax=Brachionus plicatilis TaxID=10195 RepID=A0A3M7PTI3_BRAPC|nr:hypothetical protein BpHYR1_019075 [Brachionus plicatilis]